MFNWYRGQIKQHGVIGATRLFWSAGWSKTRVDLRNKLLRPKLACPCCGWTGHRFYDYIELGYRLRNLVCPQCESHARHRAFFLWLGSDYRLQNHSGVALVFAAETALASVWQEAEALQVYRIDLGAARGRDLLGDLTKLPIATNAVDLIWCHHVLEHIEDDRAAIRELYRVLRPARGELIISVPMIPAPKTEEYGFCDLTRSGHWRIYGADFADRLAEGGFSVRTVDYSPTAEDRERYQIAPEHFYICNKSGTLNENSTI